MNEARNIYQRLHEVMKECSYVQKEDKKVNGQYTFVSHDAVTAKLRPAFIKNGIVYHPVELVQQCNGNRTEVTFKVRFVNVDDPEDFIDVPTFGYGIDPQDKGPGKAMSYGVKYALLKTLGLETGDDPEQDNIDHSAQAQNGNADAKKAAKPASQRQKLLTQIKTAQQKLGVEKVNKIAVDAGFNTDFISLDEEALSIILDLARAAYKNGGKQA